MKREDEFPEITVLSHYPQIHDPLKLFRASLAAQPDVAVVCAGSAIHAMEAWHGWGWTSSAI